jgi:dipeptidyl aminopeptidase/acylaminoacyl peptidase
MKRAHISRLLAISAIILLSVALFQGDINSARGATETLASIGSPDTLTTSDIVAMERASDFNVSPGGTWAAWVKTKPDEKENKSKRNVFITSLLDTCTIALTRASGENYSPRFSPDGSLLAFLRKKEKENAQIYIYDMRGGAPEKITSVKTGVRDFSWRSRKEICFTAREDSTFRELQLKKKKDDAVVVADQEHYAPVRLYCIELESKRTRRITTNAGQITELSISPDGRWVVTSENQDVNYTYDFRIPPRQFLLDLETGQRGEIFVEPHVDPYRFTWDNDSKGFYCLRTVSTDSTDTYVGIRRLYYYDRSSGALEKVALSWERGLGRFFGLVKSGIVVGLADGVRDRIALVTKSQKGFRKRFLESPSGREIMPLACDRHGAEIVYSASNASTVPDIMAARIKNGRLTTERRIIALNESLKKKAMALTDVIRWTGALGDEIEGILYYPASFRAGERRPLIVSLHGGPAGVDRDFFTENWSNYPHLLASKGCFVLKVNYHGSGNYGLAWVESIKGHYYEYEVPDIIGGVDHLVEAGLVDENRLAIMGWSNGSILAIECCLTDNRFKALCAGAGDVNWISDYGNCKFGAAFDNAYLGGPPWENIDLYIEKSPFFRLKEMRTPTLIMFGTNDTSVPTEQGWEHFRAMQQIGEAPVRFVLFPGAAHGLSKPSHQRRKMEEEIAWLDVHLFERRGDKNESLDESSPLAFALRKAAAARSGHLLGEKKNGVLVPETVTFKGITVGRFEVTRAQYGEFDPGYSYEPGTGNYPANGVSFEDARSYCAWLGEKTGRGFRLPTDAELRKLLGAAKSNMPYENNLERWAGYCVTPDETEMLERKIAELERTRLLLEEVGSFKPFGANGIYDLGGNVAEWTIDANGVGKPLGYSARSTRDARVSYTAPPESYIGMRVCEDVGK